MKALILAGGTGSRLRPITYSMAKQLIPVANKPVIEYGIESLAHAGIEDFGIIIGDTGPAVQAAVGDGSRWGVSIRYIPQEAPLGLAHAVKTARPYLGDDEFVMYLGDNLIKSSIAGLMAEFQMHGPAATILLTEVPNPGDFGVAEMTGGRVTRLQEKPKHPRSNLALVGVYLFDARIHEVIDTLQPSRRGEYEITDAIQGLIDRGLTVRSHIVDGWWKDTGTVEAILDANRLILEDLAPKNEGEVSGSEIEGPVAIGPGARVVDSKLRGPIVIGANCVIQSSAIGPYTSIDANTRLERIGIEDSIVLADCVLREAPGRIERSLIGRGVSVLRSGAMQKKLQLVLGDSSSLELP